MKIRLRVLLLFLLIAVMILAEIYMYDINILRYTDEFLACILGVYAFLYALMKRYVPKPFDKILYLMFAVLTIGLISNALSGKQTSATAIILDIISNFKIILLCLGFSIMVDKKTAIDLTRMLRFICKAFLVVGMFCGVLSIFVDIGMRNNYRFGLWSFNFIFKYAHVYALVILFCLLIVCQSESTLTSKNLYVFIAAAQLAFTLKGPALVTALLLVALPFILKKQVALKLRHFILIGALGGWIGLYQIQSYLLNQNAPRFTLIKYGFKTAASHFPIGSGFATYGSDMAAKYYSSLYYEYGFNSLYGMNSSDYQFLNDNYWPSIMGQFGFIGALLMIIILFLLFIHLQQYKLESKIKATVLSCYLYALIASMGNTIYTTSATIIMFLGIIIVLKCNSQGEDEDILSKFQSCEEIRFYEK